MCEVVRTLQLNSDRDAQDVVGDLSVCLDGMQVDPETFASAETTGEKYKPAADSPGQIQQRYWSKNECVLFIYVWASITYFM